MSPALPLCSRTTIIRNRQTITWMIVTSMIMESRDPKQLRINAMVRKGGFEPPRLSAPPPQDGVSASSTTSAHVKQHHRGVFDYSRTNLSRFGAAAYTAGWIHCHLVVLDRTRSISSGVELEGFIHDERGDCGYRRRRYMVSRCSIGVKVVRAGKGQDRSPHHIEQTEADSGRK